jgi:hypothetical protein
MDDYKDIVREEYPVHISSRAIGGGIDLNDPGALLLPPTADIPKASSPGSFKSSTGSGIEANSINLRGNYIEAATGQPQSLPHTPIPNQSTPELGTTGTPVIQTSTGALSL